MHGRMKGGNAMSRLVPDSRSNPAARFLVVGVMLLFISVVPAFSYEWARLIQCASEDGNLNAGDLGATSVGSFLADSAFEHWGGLEGYFESAQVPMDQDAGNPGTRQHAGLGVVKIRSKSSPKFMDALVNKTVLQCTIEFWDRSASPEVELYEIVLTDARVESIEIHSSGTDANGVETIVFRAGQIKWHHIPTHEHFTDTLASGP